MKEVRLCFSGFGAVGQRFAQLLLEKEVELAEHYGLQIRVTGISTPSRGTLIDSDGLDLRRILASQEKNRRFNAAAVGRYCDCGVAEMLERVQADVFCEMSTLSIADGEPAASYIAKAFAKGMHVITTNKGPEAHQYQRLRALANKAGRRYLYETIVMDGAPVFNFAEECLKGNRILKIRGVLNGTTNFLLAQYEKGIPYEEAIAEAQRMHWAEADPSYDVDGWDGAAKICALANILMDAEMIPQDVERVSLRSIGPIEVHKAAMQGMRYKYLCEAARDPSGSIRLRVAPHLLPASDLLSTISGNSAAVTFYADLAGEITSVLTDGTILQTAYGVYSDLLRLAAWEYPFDSGVSSLKSGGR